MRADLKSQDQPSQIFRPLTHTASLEPKQCLIFNKIKANLRGNRSNRIFRAGRKKGRGSFFPVPKIKMKIREKYPSALKAPMACWDGAKSAVYAPVFVFSRAIIDVAKFLALRKNLSVVSVGSIAFFVKHPLHLGIHSINSLASCAFLLA